MAITICDRNCGMESPKKNCPFYLSCQFLGITCADDCYATKILSGQDLGDPPSEPAPTKHAKKIHFAEGGES